MKFSVEHELPGRLRLRCPAGSFTRAEARAIEAILETQPGVLGASASHRTGSLLLLFEGGVRESLLIAVKLLDESVYGDIDMGPAPRDESLGTALVSFLGGVVTRSLMPAPIRFAVTFFRSLPVIVRGLSDLVRSKKLNVSVLDASAVGISLLMRDFRTASVITTLLALGSLLENMTHKMSRKNLTDSLALNIDKLWVRKNGEETLISMTELEMGDEAVLRAGSVIPVDGVVIDGDAMVNQSAMTGESEPVRRTAGLSVFAGTVVDEGALVVRVTALDSETRIRRIADMIDESEDLKAGIQTRAEKLADAIVPYSFLLAGGIYLWTRDVTRATAALLVDYSCAIKLSTPLAILSAMNEGAKRGVVIKGGKFLEALAAADTVVFDKTGTLSVSSPSVAEIIPLRGYSRKDVLRMAACLEEHFPHSVARAVVKLAEREDVHHREEHSSVEYVVAHGVVSRIGDETVLIGSAHFVFDDARVTCTPGERAMVDEKSGRYSVLLLAVGGALAGILCVEDPLREDAYGIVGRLREAGVRRVAMLTGDNARGAANVARMLGIDDVRAQLLPEGKTEAIKRMKENGAVVMVGDGVNDSPALSAADVSVAMRSGADIAREVADIVLTENRLGGIIDARRLSVGVMRKIYTNYAFIVGANSLLLLLGLAGRITPGVSALLHNLATIGSGVYSLAPILPGTPPDVNGDGQ
ncbi:MAG: heavy metal translocating P-type ATPase [Synergistaceae bacterium]|jgi:Cu2+-exporting ATPase|nr:heavy metal translocating P-type ATPase [Synergistaceae bacterium]